MDKFSAKHGGLKVSCGVEIEFLLSKNIKKCTRTQPKARVNETFRNPELGATLRTLAEEGPGWLYGGPLGNEVAAAAQAAVNPKTGKYGLVSAADIAGYRAVRRPPLRGRRGRRRKEVEEQGVAPGTATHSSQPCTPPSWV